MHGSAEGPGAAGEQGADREERDRLQLAEQALRTQIQVNRQVFEELRKNLMEYADDHFQM